ncbi:MAG: DEAD/DEAH box helicase, partial [Anaerolineae bacterium]
MSLPLDRMLARWRAEPNIGGNICTWHTTPPQVARTTPLPPVLHPELQETLHRQGIDALYTHQAQAWEAVQRGENVALITPTASGKSLAYNLPVLDALLRDPQASALYIFPTKALTQDQYHTLQDTTQLLAGAGIAIYDGDTPSHLRPGIRKEARLLLTNPDMLHYGILP